MAFAKVRLDHLGIGQKLRSDEAGAAVLDLAFQVKDAVDGRALPVSSGSSEHPERTITATVTQQVTDRARAVVTIAHPAGVAMQAKHGVLTQAAASVGLEVRS